MIADDVWFRTGGAETTDANSPKFIPGSCGKFVPDIAAKTSTTSVPDKTTANPARLFQEVTEPKDIAACTLDMKVVIDRRFEHWVDSLGSWSADSTASLDIVGLGANAAGGIVGGLGGQITNVISGFLTSTKKTVNQDIFMTQAVQDIMTQMKGDRSKWSTIIDARIQATYNPDETKATTSSKPAPHAASKAAAPAKATVTTTTTTTTPGNTALPYHNLSEAWDDLQTYSRQGSFNDALAELHNNVAAQAAACSADKINVKQGTSTNSANGTTTGASGSKTTTTSTPTPAPATSTTKCQTVQAPATSGG